MMQVAGEILKPPKPLPWYSDKLAWHMSFSRGQLRKLPILADIHELLKRENEAGSITRQEAVSMVPPLFLKVQSHHRVGLRVVMSTARCCTAHWVNTVWCTDSRHVCCTWLQDSTDFGDASCWNHDANRCAGDALIELWAIKQNVAPCAARLAVAALPISPTACQHLLDDFIGA